MKIGWGHERRVFLDASALYAVADRDDGSHREASRLLTDLVTQRAWLFTSNYMVAKVHALLVARANRYIAAQARAQLDSGRTATVVRVSARDERRARQIIAQYDDKDFSLADATSFAIMERLRIVRAFTPDVNFAQFGWIVVPSIDRR